MHALIIILQLTQNVLDQNGGSQSNWEELQLKMLREQLSELITSYKQTGYALFRDIIAKINDSTELNEEMQTLKYTEDTPLTHALSELAGANYEKLLKLQYIFEDLLPTEEECFRGLLKQTRLKDDNNVM